MSNPMLIQSQEFESARIMIIDDESINIDILYELLQSEGYKNISFFTSPVDACSQYRQQHYDLVLLDIVMPEMDGFEVMDCFSSYGKVIPAAVIILTAKNDKSIRIRALEKGARDFIAKPFDQDEVLCRVRNLLEINLSLNKLNNYSEILEEAVQDRTTKLVHTQLEIVRRLAYAAEYRDTETANHTMRVGWYSKLIGQDIGLEEIKVGLLFQASPMHDIGKIGIPDKILLKPGKLEEEEWDLMKRHTTIGAKILGDDNSELIQTAREISLYHHEKWDGSGYPRGLSGEAIPINGRIVSIADVYDALTSERPYKKPWKVEEALDYIRQESGKFFDPELTNSFFRVLPDILEVQEKMKDG